MTTETQDHVDYVRAIMIDHPFLKGVRLRFLPLLMEGATVVRAGADERIFREGEQARHLYLLYKGRLALETFVPREGTTIVQTVEAGEAVGLSWLFPPCQWQFSARAIEPCELVALDANNLREKAHENPEFGYDLLTRMAKLMWQRLQNTRRRLVELYVA
ncbi:MAG: cyclic nucleotide-binding domain-containing protein [Verrucomicrobia subdivision 3 bacterium]|nr:cyclic nucleotide-binding domain-containing protein [Limisphaerales bacterium]